MGFFLDKNTAAFIQMLSRWWVRIKGAVERVESLFGTSASGGLKPSTFVAPMNRDVLVKVTSAMADKGKYNGQLQSPFGGSYATGNLTAAMISEGDAEACEIWNLAEVGKGTHDLTENGTYSEYMYGKILFRNNENKWVVAVREYDAGDCA